MRTLESICFQKYFEEPIKVATGWLICKESESLEWARRACAALLTITERTQRCIVVDQSSELGQQTGFIWPEVDAKLAV